MLDVLFQDGVGRVLILIYAAMIGLCLGSFASAISARTHKGLSWILRAEGGAARSCCPSCHHQLKWIDLIPLFSWLSLKGCCRYCSRSISGLYPFIELVGGLTAFFILSGAGLSWSSLFFIIALPFSLAGLLLSIQRQKCPNYILVALGGSYAGSLFMLKSFFVAPVFLLIGGCYLYMTRQNFRMGLPQILFFAYGMNLMLTFCQMFTFHL